LISKTPYDVYWGWEPLSLLYHVETQHLKDSNKTLPPLEWSKALSDASEVVILTPKLKVVSQGQIINLPPPNLSLLDNKTLLESL